MSSNKDNKTFEKLKQFFRINRGGPNLGELPFKVCVPTSIVLLYLNFTGALRVKDDYTLTEDQGLKISSESTIHTRIKAIEELAEIAKSHRLEEVMFDVCAYSCIIRLLSRVDQIKWFMIKLIILIMNIYLINLIYCPKAFYIKFIIYSNSHLYKKEILFSKKLKILCLFYFDC